MMAQTRHKVGTQKPMTCKSENVRMALSQIGTEYFLRRF